jgi:hypothetical protein
MCQALPALTKYEQTFAQVNLFVLFDHPRHIFVFTAGYFLVDALLAPPSLDDLVDHKMPSTLRISPLTIQNGTKSSALEA